jgi:hypothetical protein
LWDATAVDNEYRVNVTGSESLSRRRTAHVVQEERVLPTDVRALRLKDPLLNERKALDIPMCRFLGPLRLHDFRASNKH